MMAEDRWKNLQQRCFKAARKHFCTLGSEAFLGLPAPVIKDLLPHLTVCQLEKLQPGLNQRGISTYSAWVKLHQLIYGHGHVSELLSEEQVKSEIMNLFFTLAFFGYRQKKQIDSIIAEDGPSLLWMAARYMRHFRLLTARPSRLDALKLEERPLLGLLEQNVSSVSIGNSFDLCDEKNHILLFVLHRLLDHGGATKLRLHCPALLSWLLHRRGSQYEDAHLASRRPSAFPAGGDPGAPQHVVPCKRLKVEESSPGGLCSAFPACEGASSPASGRIYSLEVERCDSGALDVLGAALPTFFSLRSLTLHSDAILQRPLVWALSRALRLLSHSSQCSLTELHVSTLPEEEFLETLLECCPALQSLHVEIQRSLVQAPLRPPQTLSALPAELPLQRLTVKLTDMQTESHFITSALRHCPHLVHLHLVGLRLSSGHAQRRLLATITESSRALKSLHLEDMKLSHCLADIVLFLRVCRLEHLELNDCRLLEQSADKEQSLLQLVEALKAVPSLQTLSLTHNRLAQSVCVLAQLFSGPAPSSLKHLNISSNFIQPVELLQFAVRLKAQRPPRPLTLQLMRNPGDRDPDTWTAALEKLASFCVLQVEVWKSTDTMVDHIGNM